jgi:hypothetical protein
MRKSSCVMVLDDESASAIADGSFITFYAEFIYYMNQYTLV